MYLDTFKKELKAKRIKWCVGCPRGISHKRGWAQKPSMVVHLDSAIRTISTLYRGLHEIGHLVIRDIGVPFWEVEAAANAFAESRIRKLNIRLPQKVRNRWRRYVKRVRQSKQGWYYWTGGGV
jgi:hypothetical protein